MKKVSLVITDLDNTLWDWFGMWHARFSAMLDELQVVTSISRADLIREIQQVHQKHHTSEYAFVLQELDCLKKYLGRDVDPRKDFPTVIEKAQEARRKVAETYLGVKETLQAIKARGARIVAFTESQIFYTSQRIREFDLDGIIDVLYSTPDQKTLSPEEIERVRKHPADFYQLKKTVVRALPDRLVKPSPEILTTILNDEMANLANSIYIGDSLTKDIAMAADCGVTSVYAEYGVSTDKDDYDLLRKVTHWNEAAVEKERHTTRLQVQPDITLKHGFSELMLHFDFTSCACHSDADIDREVDFWKESVATQRHFNDLQLSLRGILVTLVTGVVGSAGYALTQHSELVTLGVSVNLGTVIALAGIVAVKAIQHFDRGYHALLVGAVKNGIEIEKRLLPRLPGIGLALNISKSSKERKWCFGLLPQNSDLREAIFYRSLYAVLVLLAVFSFISKPGAISETLVTAPEESLTSYYSSGYPLGVEQVAVSAIRHLDEALLQKPLSPTLVCDIDETALSNWPLLSAEKFLLDSSTFEKFAKSKKSDPLLPILRLYEYAISQGVKVVFLSCRSEEKRISTEANLKAAGFKGPHVVILKSQNETLKTRQFKSAQRKKLESQGATIVINIGDQLADLDMPPSSNDFLIPNPFYREH